MYISPQTVNRVETLKFERREKGGMDVSGRAASGADERRAGPFAKKALLVAAALGIGSACSPEVKIENNIEAYQPDAGGACVATCEPADGILREEGNSAGPNEMALGLATVRFKGLVEDGSARKANMELSGCDETESAEADIAPEATTTLTIGNESVDVTVVRMEYDGAGLKVTVTAEPVCPGQDGAAGAAGSGTEDPATAGGAGGASD